MTHSLRNWQVNQREVILMIMIVIYRISQKYLLENKDLIFMALQNISLIKKSEITGLILFNLYNSFQNFKKDLTYLSYLTNLKYLK